MSFLFIGSTGNHAGRSLTTWTIAKRLSQRGLDVGFIKPFGSKPIHTDGIWTDSDALLLKNVLNLELPLEKICPYPVPEEALLQKEPEEILEEFQSLAHELEDKYDVLIIMGTRHIFFDDTAFPVNDIKISMSVMANFILVDRYRGFSRSIYSILSVRSLLEDRIKGIILNRVPQEHVADVEDKIGPYVARKGLPLTAIIPEEPALTFLSLEEIRRILDGTFLCGGEKRHQPVGGMTAGAADLKGDLALFKRVYNKIVLLDPQPNQTKEEGPGEGARVAGVVLTGNRKPAVQIVEAAKKAGIPLIMVNEDTFGTLERLEKSPSTLSPEDHIKVDLFTDLFNRKETLDRLLDTL